MVRPESFTSNERHQMSSKLETVTLRLRKGQRERLQSLFPRKPYNEVIRTIIDNFIRDAETEIAKRTASNDRTQA